MFKDGNTIERVWKDRSGTESWTPDMRELARQRRITEGRLPELEIQTRDVLYSGTLEAGVSLSEVVNHLKEYLNINITCEYKGGERHA